ncbi:MAG: hypothetical protein AAFR21_12620 [Pseudomonadota bacterium]
MFGIKLKFDSKSAPEGQLVVARLNAKVQPMDRGEYFEDPLEEFLKRQRLGEVVGGGTMMSEYDGGIDFCEIELELPDASDKVLKGVISQLEALGAPKGSALFLDNSQKEIPFGIYEGLALVLNGTDLPEEVYEESDINALICDLDEALGAFGSFRSFRESHTETVLYFYGPSYDKMRSAIADLVAQTPLCERSRTEKIA